jgi:hypothetical protein
LPGTPSPASSTIRARSTTRAGALVPDPPLQLPPIDLGYLDRPHVRSHEKWST